ncbi:MAG TPA: glycoside hydrolase family 36 protein, partial [Microlunatus sp.]|nr:glycoside hydrolase family 36 protein [Microlunatus sp.]
AVREQPGPTGWLAGGLGDLDDGAAALRRLVVEELITVPDLSDLPGEPEFPCLVANSWGVQEDTSTARILGMMDATAAVGAEVFVVDKGWERSVGDWHPNDRFPTGLRTLSDEARRRGMGFGIWCGWGNADRRSPVALEHPDWLATWRGHVPTLSFDNLGLCLGHDPARDWVLAELTRMITEFGLSWLLHDFETITRCDSTDHTHDPGAGEHAAEAAFHHILRTLRSRFPLVVLENCWNGVRPLDLAMIRSHHTTITEDHCRTHYNSLAKVGLGRYLPLDWQSAYMGADDLPTRARIAPYVIGGPWVLMDDPDTWTAESGTDLGRAVEVYKRWRGPLRTAAITRPVAAPATVDSVLATCGDGRALLAVSVPPGVDRVELGLDLVGDYVITDEWSGRESARSTLSDAPWPIDVDPGGAGLIFSLSPHRAADQSTS